MVELMAPCGNFETLRAAIKAGCDSVYFGVEQLNMRARNPRNFKIDEIEEVMKICHKNNIKGYIAINTIIYDHEDNLSQILLEKAKEAKVDAIIAFDMAVIQKARDLNIPIHISTQVNVSNFESCKFYAQFADRIVLARELTLPLIQKITKKIQEEDIKGPLGKLLEIEVFIHGALCVAISGRCYMSLYNENASANRGACIQTCRRSYIVKDKETGQELEIENDRVMSPKDLCTISFLDKIIDAGVHTLKIEGRARAADYVFTTVKCYREAIEAIKNGTYNKELIDRLTEQLQTVYNRGFSSGYFLGTPADFWSKSYGSVATEVKDHVGTITNYYEQPKVALMKIESGEINIGDEIIFIGPTTGYHRQKVEELMMDEKPIKKATKGEDVTIKVTTKVRKNDQVYIIKKSE